VTLAELAQRAQAEGISLGRLGILLESEETGIPSDEIAARVREMVRVMNASLSQGLGGAESPAFPGRPSLGGFFQKAGSEPMKGQGTRPEGVSCTRSRSGLSGGDAAKVAGRVASGRNLPGNTLLAKSVAYALAVSEVNAAMGKIVAAPTAGSCGVIPGTFFALAEASGACEEALVDALSAAGLIGQVIGERVGLSGAQAGCQAECGSAAAMAAAGLVQLGGGSPEDCIHASAFALKGLMGLVCDPVAGLVEIPCIKRNATSAAVALASAEMALSGVRSRIPPDEVISAMAQVGRMMSPALRETSQGGLAATPTGLRFSREMGGKT